MSGAVTFPADPSDHCLVWPEEGPGMAVGRARCRVWPEDGTGMAVGRAR
jgi:hypothetical protein